MMTDKQRAMIALLAFVIAQTVLANVDSDDKPNRRTNAQVSNRACFEKAARNDDAVKAAARCREWAMRGKR